MSVNRLIIFCEGQTEETFCNIVLEPHFRSLGVIDVRPLLLPNKAGSNRRVNKGGWIRYDIAKAYMKKVVSDQCGDGVWFTTLFDYYALPSDFPAPQIEPRTPVARRVQALERAMEADLSDAAGGRFVARLQLHEFEALLYSDINAIQRSFPDRTEDVSALRSDVEGLMPEEINDHPETAPSKRLIRYIPEYKGRKTSAGPLIVKEIGLDAIRAKCPHFNSWLARLEAAC